MQETKLKTLLNGFPCLLTLLIGFIVTMSIFQSLRRMENDKVAVTFQQRAEARVRTLQAGIDDVLQELRTINQFFTISGAMNRRQFSTLTETLIADASYIEVFCFQRHVAAGDIKGYVKKLTDAMPGVSLKDYRPGGFGPLTTKQEYRIVDFIEPLRGNEQYIGIDVSTHAHDTDAHLRAMTTGGISATKPYQLLNNPHQGIGAKLLLPVFKPGMPIETKSERRAAYVGDVAVVLHLASFIEKIMTVNGLLTHTGLNYQIFDGTDGESVMLYTHADPADDAVQDFSTVHKLLYSHEHRFSTQVNFADRAWKVQFEQAPLAMLEHHTGSLISLILGTLMTLVSAVYVNTITNRAKRVQTLIDASTNELKRTNELLLQDSAARKRAEARVSHMAHHDALTGLANRALLQDRLSQAIARGARYKHQVWVVFLDLDRFKNINDSLGHTAGDDLLSAVSQRLSGVVRETDTVARFGGDEFVMLIAEDTDAPLDKCCLTRVMDAIGKPLLVQGHDVIVTASIGVSVYPNDSCDAGTLIEQADLAMYRAKELGRNNIQFYTKSLNEKLLEKLKLERALHDAISRNQFALYFQPQVDARTGQIVGAEALLRWRHPVHGIVSPGEFIGLAEASGLITPIGEWVLREACANTKRWHELGYPALKIGVNVSARQFAHTDLVSLVRNVLDETRLTPCCLDLELTESCIMSDVERTITTLTELKALGVKLSIDDFGTGYSSLAYLQRFPLDVLKIDQSFVNDIHSGSGESAIVASVIGLSHNLKLQVIAEGVETLEQLLYLRELGCDEVQGYFFSKPLPPEEFEALLTKKVKEAVTV